MSWCRYTKEISSLVCLQGYIESLAEIQILDEHRFVEQKLSIPVCRSVQWCGLLMNGESAKV